MRVSMASVLAWALILLTWIAVPLLGWCTWYQLKDPKPQFWPREALLHTLKDWTLWAIIGATLLVWIDPGKRLRAYRKRLRANERVSHYLEEAIQRIKTEHTKASKSRDFQRAWECLMQAAQFEIESALDLDGHSTIKANLVFVHSEDEIEVMARSRAGSPYPVKHQNIKDWPVYRSMTNNETVCMTITDLPDGHAKRTYRSIAATPIARGRQAFGAIAVDSQETSQFHNKEAVIDRILRPICAIALLTIPGDNECLDCSERYSA